MVMLAPNLACLYISRCSQIKEIISTAKCAGLPEKVGSIKPYEKLEVLHLSYLPELKCIYQDPLPFESLKKISIFGCPKLKKLSINAKNAEGHGIAIHGWELWWKELEWEDETTKNAFVPCFKSMPRTSPHSDLQEQRTAISEQRRVTDDCFSSSWFTFS